MIDSYFIIKLLIINLLTIIAHQYSIAQFDKTILLNEHDKLMVTQMQEIVNKIRTNGCKCGQDIMPPVVPVMADYKLCLAAKASSVEFYKTNTFDHRAKTIYGNRSSERIDYFDNNRYWNTSEIISQMDIKIDLPEVAAIILRSEFHCKALMDNWAVSFGFGVYPDSAYTQSKRGYKITLMMAAKEPFQPNKLNKNIGKLIIIGNENDLWTQALINMMKWYDLPYTFQTDTALIDKTIMTKNVEILSDKTKQPYIIANQIVYPDAYNDIIEILSKMMGKDIFYMKEN